MCRQNLHFYLYIQYTPHPFPPSDLSLPPPPAVARSSSTPKWINGNPEMGVQEKEKWALTVDGRKMAR